MNLTTLLVMWVIIGLVAGVVANKVIRTQAWQNGRLELGAGAFGALCAGMVFYILDVPKVENFTAWSIIAATAGAALVLFMLRMYTGTFGLPPAHQK